VMKVWIAQRVTELLGIEDDVLIAYIYEQLEGHKVLKKPLLYWTVCGCRS
jgi:PWI domain